MALGTLAIETTVGAITAPDSVSLSFGSVISPTLSDWGLFQPLSLPTLRSIGFFHGLDHQRHVYDGTSYRLGLLAPQAAQTIASTATKATQTLTFSGQPADQAQIRVWHQSAMGGGYVRFVSSLNTSSVEVQVKIGADQDATLTNLYELFTNTGVEGTDYATAAFFALGGLFTNYKDYINYWGIEASAMDASANTITFRAMTAGAHGNAYISIESVADGNLAFGATTFAGGTSGTGNAPEIGSYLYAYQYLRPGDGALSGRSATTTFEHGANYNLNQTSFVDATTRDGATHVRTLRSTTDAKQLYKIADQDFDDAEPYVDPFSDATISGDGASLYNPAIHRLYAAGYPTVGRYAALFKGHVFTGGALIAADYARGTASVTEDGYTVTLSTDAKPKENWIGRTFTVTDHTVEYLIVGVAESTRVLTLNLAYQGTTAAAATYNVSDKRNPFDLHYSAANLPNNWPVTQTLTGITSSDPSGIAGIRAFQNFLVVFTKTGLWAVEGGSGSGFRITHVGEGMGCYGGHAIVDVDGTLMWIGPDGIHAWSGGEVQSLSSPRSGVGELPAGIERTLARINQDETDGICGNYDPGTGFVEWLVPLDGDTRNNHAIVFNTQSGEFSLDDRLGWTFIASIPNVAGDYVTLAGDAFGNLWQTNVGNCDGVFAVEPITTLSSYTASTRTLSLSGSPGLPTASGGLAGCPVAVVDNTGAIQIGKVATNTASSAVLVSPLSSSPSGTTKVIFGAIVMDVQTARYDWKRPELYKWLRATTVTFDPQSIGRLYVAAGTDDDDPALYANRTTGANDYADLSASDGEKFLPHRTDRGRRLVQRFLALTPGYDVTVPGYVSEVGMLDPVGVDA